MINEVNNCIGCGLCEKSCPMGISPKTMIELCKSNPYTAKEYSYSKNPFSGVCAYICPNKFCMSNCKKSVDIKKIKQYIINLDDNTMSQDFVDNNKKIAIVGGGVSGLTTTWYYSHRGYNVHLFEKKSVLGGQLNLIPKQRLPKEVVKKDINNIVNKNNVFVHTDTEFVDDGSYEKVIYCLGAKPRKLDIHIESCPIPVIYYDEYLSQESEEENIVIIGGGNVALDCAIHNKGHSTLCIRRNYWDLRIDEKDFKTLRDNKISIIDNFTPLEIKCCSLFGLFHDNDIEINCDKIVIAIGREQVTADNLSENELQIVSSDSVIETISTTLEQIKNHSA